jgi:hypothetical protein
MKIIQLQPATCNLCMLHERAQPLKADGSEVRL